MPPYRTFGSNRGAGLPARSYLSVVLVLVRAGGEPPRPPERKLKKVGACLASHLLPRQTQAKTPRASQAWRDIRPRVVKAGLSPSQAPAPLSVPAANSLMCARSVRGTRKPHDARKV